MPAIRRSICLVAISVASALALAAPAHAACTGADTPMTDAAAAERSILCLVNEYRIANGRQALVVDPRLARAARLHSEDMVDRNYFDHTSPEGSTPTSRARAQGYPSGVGENIAYGYRTPRGTFEGWRNSPGHNRNMLDEDYTVTGVGIDPARGGMATQVFGFEPPPPGGDTGLGTPSPSDSQSCSQAQAALPALRAAVASAQSLVTRRAATVKADKARVKDATTRAGRARALRRLARSRKKLASARAQLAGRQRAFLAAQLAANEACSR